MQQRESVEGPLRSSGPEGRKLQAEAPSQATQPLLATGVGHHHKGHHSGLLMSQQPPPPRLSFWALWNKSLTVGPPLARIQGFIHVTSSMHRSKRKQSRKTGACPSWKEMMRRLVRLSASKQMRRPCYECSHSRMRGGRAALSQEWWPAFISPLACRAQLWSQEWKAQGHDMSFGQRMM